MLLLQVQAYRAMQALHQSQEDEEGLGPGGGGGRSEELQQRVVQLLGQHNGHLLHKLHRLLYLEQSVFG
jgi:hypothetical protein